jgi:hypothetical protein
MSLAQESRNQLIKILGRFAQGSCNMLTSSCSSAMLLQSDNRAFASADDDEDDEEPAPPPKQAVLTRPSAAAAGRGGGRAGAAAAAGKGPKDAAARQAEYRAKKLQEEAEVGGRLARLQASAAPGCASGFDFAGRSLLSWSNCLCIRH